MPVFMKSRKKELDEDDLYEALKDHKSNYLGDKMCTAWEKELKMQIKKKQMPNLLKATLKVFGWKIVLHGILLACIEFFLKWVSEYKSFES